MFNLVEEFPSPRASHVLKLGGLATLLVLLPIAGYVLLNLEPREPAGQVLDVKLYVPHAPGSEASPTTNPRADSAANSRADVESVVPGKTLLVLTPVKIENTSDQPFSIFDLSGVVRLGDAEYESADVSPEDFQRVFQFYPDLSPYQQEPLLRNSVIQPGQTLEGLLVFNYQLSEEQWDQRTSFQVRASFDHGRDIVLSGTDTPDNWPKLSAEAR
jgi:hypothetical protein